MSILVLIASLNIVSGLIMLVKNKGRDIGILRTMGLTEGAILRVFFLCGALTGIVGTVAGVILGCLFAVYIDPIFSFVKRGVGRRGLGPVHSRHLLSARQTAGAGRRLGGGAVVGAVVCGYDLSGTQGRTDEPG